ncbi:MAG: hypothetical protein HKN57_08645 [Xanthomonadales bacterium]|nr:hypothetical protein [Gammaproteobacteria bacterium]MBT8054913.1 hypothetical protein [Gammaproteobacteria bacterium]NND57309.1 hypothetical protein [Xanthomonadales bacterium]NNK51043.1 hypothetical protein [Xanthomonadales bacterium]
MSMWTAIALIVVAGIAGEAWRHHLKSRSSGASKEALDQLNNRMDALDAEMRERVETLERIVTDSKDDLKRQFDHLDKAG